MYYLLLQNEEESDASDDDSDEGEDEAMEEGGEVDQNFRIELMKVLQNQGAVVGVLWLVFCSSSGIVLYSYFSRFHL